MVSAYRRIGVSAYRRIGVSAGGHWSHWSYWSIQPIRGRGPRSPPSIHKQPRNDRAEQKTDDYFEASMALQG